MTVPGEDAADRIDERIVRHTAIDVILEVGNVVPIPVGLDPFYPLEHSRDPLDLLGPFRALLVGAGGFREGTKVDVRKSSLAPLLVRSVSQVVVQLANVAHSSGEQRAATPPAASLKISPALSVAVRRETGSARSRVPVSGVVCRV